MTTLIVPRELYCDDMDMESIQCLNELYRDGRFDEYNRLLAMLLEVSVSKQLDKDD